MAPREELLRYLERVHRAKGIDARYVARVQAAGFKDLTVEQIVTLHDHGVD
jgi:hypothetical protein